MTREMKTPGVYIDEKNAFPNSVVEVPTAVPAFVGYTERHEERGRSLKGEPRMITSMADFHDLFGFGPEVVYTLSTTLPTLTATQSVPSGPQDPVAKASGTEYYLSRKSPRFYLYYSMILFYQNGGGRCYVVSVGDYGSIPDGARIMEGIEALEAEPEPTMLVIPDAVLLDAATCGSVQTAALEHCGRVMRNRVAILDIHKGYLARATPDPVADFRDGPIGVNNLDFGAAYYPWLETTLVQDSRVGFRNLDAAGRTVLKAVLEDEGEISADLLTGLGSEASEGAEDDVRAVALDRAMKAESPRFNALVEQIVADLNLLPPSGAMAGIYTMVDNERGVWKAPANVSLNSVIRPVVEISHEEQEDLNVSPQGKSVNAIRSFVGKGTLVWGARTLDGNSMDWRYISVRRTMIMLEQSIRLAARAYVFEPNDARTWVTLKSMIEDFLVGIWRRGGLVGTRPQEAFGVRVGLGETMTSQDILEGILRVTVHVALTRPGEFMAITFQQPMKEA